MLPRFHARPWRWALCLCTVLVLTLSGWMAWCWVTLPDVSVLKDRRSTLTIDVRDWRGKEHPFLLGPRNPKWTPLAKIPAALKWAVIVAEDANFYTHRGIDVPAMKEALKYDLEKKRLARGASTITQQLAKNVFLSRRKSLVRKVEELVLARRLERELDKGRILELYLNVVELGPMVYGVGEGARYHFQQPVAELSPAQCAFLAAILPGPRVAYNPALKPDKVRRRAEHILRLMAGRGVLDVESTTAARGDLEGREPLSGEESVDLSPGVGTEEREEGGVGLAPSAGIAAAEGEAPRFTGPAPVSAGPSPEG